VIGADYTIAGQLFGVAMATKKKKKKKGRGKAKKAEQNQEAAKQMETPDKQMERLNIDDDTDDALLDEAIKLAAAEKEALEAAAAEQEERADKLAKNQSSGCYHGHVDTDDRFIIEDFCKTFTSGFLSLGKESICWKNSMTAGRNASYEKYPEVWRDSSKMKQIMSFFLFNATHHVLEGRIASDARFLASFACYFQEYVTVHIDKQKATAKSTKGAELLRCEHTLVRYLKKKIPCNCLDKKYEEVKSVTKMGLCRNDNCSLPNRMVERSKMLYCTRCRDANYCSRECQKADWPVHKEYCDQLVDLNAMWESRKQP